MLLDNPPNQIAGRGTLSPGKHLELLEDHLREFDCSLHDDHCPISGSPRELAPSSEDSALMQRAGLHGNDRPEGRLGATSGWTIRPQCAEVGPEQFLPARRLLISNRGTGCAGEMHHLELPEANLRAPTAEVRCGIIER